MLDSKGLRAECERRKRFLPLSEDAHCSRPKVTATHSSSSLPYCTPCPSRQPAGNSGDLSPKDQGWKRSEQPSRSFLRLGSCETGRSLFLSCGVGETGSNPSRDCNLDPPLAIVLIWPKVKDLGTARTANERRAKNSGSALCTIFAKRQMCDKSHSSRCAKRDLMKRWQKRKKADRECKFAASQLTLTDSCTATG